MPPDEKPFWRAPGAIPRAAVLSYALAALALSAGVSYGVYRRTGFWVSAGSLAGVLLGGLFVALGTMLSLLADIVDRGRRQAGYVEETDTVERIAA